MTTTISYSLTDALKLSPESMQAMEVTQLQELHNMLADSKQKKANKRADIVAGILNAKRKEEKEATKEEDAPEPVENSVKAPKKLAAKPKAKPKAASKKEEDAEEAEEKEEKAAPKPKLRKSKPKPDLDKMSADELKELAAKVIEENETFKERFPVSNKSELVRIDFDTVEDIQKSLTTNVYTTYMLVDERLGNNKLSNFLVLFANADIIILLDRNTAHKDETVTIKTSQLGDVIDFGKAGKYEYSFYIKQAIK